MNRKIIFTFLWSFLVIASAAMVATVCYHLAQIAPPTMRQTAYSINREVIRGRRAKLDYEPKVMLFGIDGADWDIINPLIEKGKLPNIAKLTSQGCHGNLRSIHPLLSPLIWTSIATGVTPDRHGILDFMAANPETGRQVPVTSNLRKVRALWDIFSEYGTSVGVVGWLATWPAEEVNGFLVSDRIAYHAFDRSKERAEARSGLAYPESLVKMYDSLALRPDDIGWDKLSRFIHLSEEDPFEALEADEKDANVMDLMTKLREIYYTAETYREIGLSLLEKHDPDFFAIYFEAVDAVEHLFIRYAPPKLPYVSERDFGLFGKTVEQIYIYQDEILGDFTAHLDEDTTLIVVSDHGFRSGEFRPRSRSEIGTGTAARWHRLNGIVIMYGNRVAKARTLYDVSVLDIAPTVLYALGYPAATDMEGRTVLEAFDGSRKERPAVQYVDTYEVAPRRRKQLASAPIESAYDEQIKAKLMALGYIGDAAPEANINLAVTYLGRGLYDLAEKKFKKALDKSSKSAIIHNGLGVIYRLKGRLPEAMREFAEAAACNPDFASAYNNLGLTHLLQGNLELASEMFEQAIVVDPMYADAHNNLGRIHLNDGDIEAAEREFNIAVKIEPNFLKARVNVATVLLKKGEVDAAIAESKGILKEDPNSIAALSCLGRAYEEKGEVELAIQQCEKILAIDPNSVIAHYDLGNIYRSKLNDLEKALYHYRACLNIFKAGKGGAELNYMIAEEVTELVKTVGREKTGTRESEKVRK